MIMTNSQSLNFASTLIFDIERMISNVDGVVIEVEI